MADAATDLSLASLFWQADFVVKTVMLALIFASFWCWAIIFDKSRNFKRSRKRSERFESMYHTSKSLHTLYDKIQNSHDTAMEKMLVVGIRELEEGVLKGVDKPDNELKQVAKERMYQSMQRIKQSTLERMSKNLIFLATIGSVSPFVGLFGTVWGIMNSFQAIALSKNTTLAVVAPGIAEALLATAIGLFAAIPAVIYYNLFSNEIRRVSSKLGHFSEELYTLLSHKV